ncbi:MAG: recombinase family protein, partial [Bacilli bacterium]|nr:recombinase family protein [Bacilli bacterium]
MRCGVYVRVSTDDQRDNGYSIDSQLRMIKEYCEKNEYDIIDVYNDAGHSGKDLMRPEMQRLLKDIKSKKIDKLIAIKVDRLTRNNYDGFWLLNYCDEHDVKIELILEPYDVSTANGEMIFGMNLVFGQRERKEIGARTKRAMEEMALEHIHPSKAPYGYIRNKETGHLEIEPIEAEIVKEIFELCKKGHSTRNIASIMKENNAYLMQGKWAADRVYKILTNSIYIGIFEYGKYKRKPQDILRVENYCVPIIDMNTWNTTRANLEKNKHPNYGDHIHLFAGLVKCPLCGEILSASESFKKKKDVIKVYYHLRCKNTSCKGYGYHYNSDKIEEKLKRVLNELTRFMFDNTNEIITSSSTKSKEVKNIEKAINKLKIQEKRLVDLYLNSTLDVETINHKNDVIKKEIDKLTKKKNTLDPDNDFKEYSVELLKKLEHEKEDNMIIFKNNLVFSFLFDSLNKKSKK